MSVTSLVMVVFWLTAIPALLGGAMLLLPLRGLPGWLAWSLAALFGAVFGIVMCDRFARLPGLRERYLTEPVNGATGVQVGCADLLMPYIGIAVGVSMLVSLGVEARGRRGLPPLRIPPWVAAIPAGSAAAMAGAALWARGRRSLHHAAIDGDLKTLARLLHLGHDPSAPDAYVGRPPLHWAISEGCTEATKLLLEAGADPDGRDGAGTPALVRAASLRVPDLVSLLLDHGADVNGSRPDGETPLMAAAEYVELAELLLDHGADLHARSQDGATPLIHAARSMVVRAGGQEVRAAESVQLLLDRGASRDARDHEGRTALDWAVKRGRNEAAEVLREAGAGETDSDQPGGTLP